MMDRVSEPEVRIGDVIELIRTDHLGHEVSRARTRVEKIKPDGTITVRQITDDA